MTTKKTSIFAKPFLRDRGKKLNFKHLTTYFDNDLAMSDGNYQCRYMILVILAVP